MGTKEPARTNGFLPVSLIPQQSTHEETRIHHPPCSLRGRNAASPPSAGPVSRPGTCLPAAPPPLPPLPPSGTQTPSHLRHGGGGGSLSPARPSWTFLPQGASVSCLSFAGSRPWGAPPPQSSPFGPGPFSLALRRTFRGSFGCTTPCVPMTPRRPPQQDLSGRLVRVHLPSGPLRHLALRGSKSKPAFLCRAPRPSLPPQAPSRSPAHPYPAAQARRPVRGAQTRFDPASFSSRATLGV